MQCAFYGLRRVHFLTIFVVLPGSLSGIGCEGRRIIVDKRDGMQLNSRGSTFPNRKSLNQHCVVSEW